LAKSNSDLHTKWLPNLWGHTTRGLWQISGQTSWEMGKIVQATAYPGKLLQTQAD